MLTKYEKETVINFNEEEPTAHVYTYNKALIKKLDKLTNSKPISKDSTGSRTYCIPKSWVKISPPRNVNLTDEQRKEIGKRLKGASKQSV